jgi:hypothetical protein
LQLASAAVEQEKKDLSILISCLGVVFSVGWVLLTPAQ